MDLLKLFLASTGVSTDTRKIEAGNLFFALKGQNFDGNQFAEMALEHGAAYSIVDNYSGDNPKIIVVDNALQSLQALASEYAQFLNIPILAITGSNGKTTSKELIASVLSKKFTLNYTKGNLNNEIGVPLTILSTQKNAEFLIVEMGANHQGEIALLSEIARPHFGLITNIGKAHLEGFGGIEGVKKGKSELYRFLALNSGKIFINRNDEVLGSLLPSQVDLIDYYTEAFLLKNDFPYLTLDYQGHEIKTHLTGIYNISNIAAAFAIGQYFGVEVEDIIDALNNYIPNNNRSELIEYKGIRIIKDAYNANPTSVMSSLSSFFTKDEINKSIVLGDMLELGEYAADEHRNILEYLAKQRNLVNAILVGPLYYSFKELYPQFTFYNTIVEAKNAIALSQFEGTVLLMKGSRGIALEKILE